MLYEVVAPKVGAELAVVSDRVTVLFTQEDNIAPFEVFELEGPRDSARHRTRMRGSSPTT